MEPQGRTSRWGIALAILVIAAGIAGFFVWESAGRPGLSTGEVALSDEAAAKMTVYHRLCEGKALAGEGKHADALAIFDDIVRTETGSAYAWDADIQAAHSMAYLGQHEEALARLDRTIADCPLPEEIPKARLTEADVYSLAGQNDRAAKLFEKLIMEYTDAWPWICEEALVGMTTVYSRTGQFGLVRAAMARLITDYRGAEDTRRKWAERGTSVLREKVHKLQAPRIEQLLAQEQFRQVDLLSPGATTWTADEGPYLVTQPLAVAPGAKLRIEAGTRIRFGVLGSLRVEGALEVAGTADQPVNLIPLSDDPTKDWWVGIELAPGEGEGGSRLSHCRVMGAEIGVRAAGGRAEVDHCTFERCGRVSVLAARRGHLTMADCEVVNGYRIGVECEAAAGLQITGGKITGLTTHGVMLKEAAGESFIRGSRIERCGWDGVLVRGTCSPMIEDCRILDNGGNGVCATEGASPAVVNTRVENNAKAGISLQERWEAAIRGSTVGGNRGGGIVAKVRCNGEITDNLIENNGRVGLSLSLDCAPSVTNNRFFKNQGPGLLLQNSQPKALRDNQFIGNAEAALRNEGDGVVQAAHNWWGSTSETEIAKLIQDRSDNPAWGEVEFRPWLSSEPRATPERESTGK